MTKPAFLLGDMDTFDKRLELIHSYAIQGDVGLNQLKTDIEMARKIKTGEITDLTIIASIKNPNDLLNIKIFCEGVEVYFNPDLYPDIFPKKDLPDLHLQQVHTPVSPILKPVNLEKMGSNISDIGNHIDVFDAKKLKDFLEKRETILNKYHQSGSMVFSCNGHSIHIGYDIKSHQWTLTNASRLPSKTMGIPDLVNALFSAFSFNQKIDKLLLKRTELYTLEGPHVAPLKKLIKNEAIKAIDNIEENAANFVDRKGKTILHHAVVTNNPHVIIALANKDFFVNPNVRPSDDHSPLQIACKRGRIDCIKALLKMPKIDINITDDDGYTPLHLAILYDQAEAAKILLTANEFAIDPNVKSKDDYTPLQLACKYGCLDSVKALLRHSYIDINLPDEEGRTPLYLAIIEGNTEIAKMLLAEPNIQVHLDHEKSPLSRALKKNQIEIVNLLIQKQIDNILENYIKMGGKSNRLQKLQKKIAMINEANHSVNEKFLSIIELLEKSLVKEKNEFYSSPQVFFSQYTSGNTFEAALNKSKDNKLIYSKSILDILHPIYSKDLPLLDKSNQLSKKQHKFYLNHTISFDIVNKTSNDPVLEEKARLMKC